MEPPFKKAELFGGAITVNIPAGYLDTSTIRQVPDHQEVFLSQSGFSSLIFDLGERVTHTSTDEEALQYHFDDIVDENDSRKIWNIRTDGVAVQHLPPHTPTLTLFATTTPPSPSPGRKPRPNTATSVTIMMGLIRLVPQATDMVITLNMPKIPGEDDEDIDFENGGFGKAVEEGRKVFEEVWRTLEVKDWSLFDGEEA